nr:hypothetical protein BaRGS_034643 [Batillaria attramentaria]
MMMMVMMTTTMITTTTTMLMMTMEAVTGFGGDLTVPPDDKNFFIGLDNLHHLSSQAGYNAQFFMKYNNWSGSGGAFYSGWTIGPASSNYSLTYTQYYANSNQPADNGLGSQLPLLFATPDHDVAGCASVRGWPGWFGADCSGYSVFADNPTWPFNGTDGVLDMVVLYMVKKTAYFDEK